MYKSKPKISTQFEKRFYRAYVFGIAIIAPQKILMQKLTRALHLIYETDNNIFQKVLNIKHILIYPGKDYYGVVFEKQRIFVDQPKTIQDSSVAYLASSLVHEAWHIDQYIRGIVEYGARAERGAYLVQRRFLSKVGKKFEVHWLDKEYKSQWWEPKGQSKETGGGYDTDSVTEYRKLFRVFIKLYKQGKLKIKDILLD